MRAVDDLETDKPGVYIAILMVDPSSRRTGAAPALALYRAEGWMETTRVSFDLGEHHLDEIVFVGPTA